LFRFTVANSGIGPAKIRSVRIAVDGKPQGRWAEVFQSLIGSSDVRFGSSTLGGRVIRAGEIVNVVTLIGEPAQRLEESLANSADRSGRIGMRICYCSVFDQCWMTKDDGKLSEPESVEECPDFGEEAFLE
jgi:hypothetical protein